MKTTSLELSKQLKEAGAKQESEWSYDKDGMLWNMRDKRNRRTHVASFDCHELLEGLPILSEVHKLQSGSFNAINWWLDHVEYSKHPAEALGKLKLWCLENGHCKE